MSESEELDILEALANLPTMAHPVASPEGDRVALYYDISGRNELHVLDVESGDLEQWSDGEVPRNARWFVDWTADGERVLFHLDDDGNEQNDIHVIDETGATEAVVKIDGQAVLSDATEEYVYFASSRDGQMNLYRQAFDADEPEKLTEYERAVWGGELAPTEDHIAYSTNETDDFDNKDVYIADADGSNPRNLEIGEVGAEAVPNDWGPDGERLLVTDNTEDLGRLGIYDLASDEIQWLGDGTYEEGGETFLPDGERVLGIRSRAAESIPVIYDVETGEGRELELPAGVASFGMWGNPILDENRVLITQTTTTTRPELLEYDLSTDEYDVLLEAEYGPFEPADFADVEYFTIDSTGVPETRQAAVEHEPYEELEIEAMLYDSGQRPSPLIVNPHGGPRARDTKRFNLYSQVLAARGYSVLQVNYRGSTGKGREFVETLIDDWGGAEQGDVVVAAEHALEEYDWLDDDRIIVFGGSYGGYSAYWQLVQYPDFYDAGIAWIGLTDLEDQYENTMPHFRTELMEKYLGTPGENPELYEERSPITHLENLSAPLLMVHGVNDRRVPVSQARLFRDALDEAGYEKGTAYEYEELGEEGHASTDQDQKLRMFRLLDDFLARRIGTEKQ